MQSIIMYRTILIMCLLHSTATGHKLDSLILADEDLEDITNDIISGKVIPAADIVNVRMRHEGLADYLDIEWPTSQKEKISFLLKPNDEIIGNQLDFTVHDENGDHSTVIEDDLRCSFIAFSSFASVSVTNCTGTVTGTLHLNGSTYVLHRPSTRRRKKREFKELYEAEEQVLVLADKDMGLTDYISQPLLAPKPLSEEELESSENIHRKRKRSSKAYYVELAIFIDEDLVKKIQENLLHGTTDQKSLNRGLINYVLAIINDIDLLYKHPSLGLSISMVIKKIFAFKTTPAFFSSMGDDIHDYLVKFCEYDDNEFLRKWDFGMLLSGRDLYALKLSGERHYATAGLAHLNSMCYPRESCTVGEGSRLSASKVMAHEMGHAFGMKHDGENECEPGFNIMSPVLGPESNTWSQCSRKDIKTFIYSLESNTFKYVMGKRENCLANKASSLVEHNGKWPGERFTADQQCQLIYGKQWIAYLVGKDVCKELWCREGRYLKSPKAGALDGTECATNKMCLYGKCVNRIEPEGAKSKGKTKNKTTEKTTGDAATSYTTEPTIPGTLEPPTTGPSKKRNPSLGTFLENWFCSVKLFRNWFC